MIIRQTQAKVKPYDKNLQTDIMPHQKEKSRKE
jgi:hypothetical protein